MLEFKDGYNYFCKNTMGVIGADITDNYLGSIKIEINKIEKDINSFEGFKTSSKILKGDIAEFWSADTLNIKEVVNNIKPTAHVDRSHGFASADISSDENKLWGLKYYDSGKASAEAQSDSILERFTKYQSKGGKDNLSKFLNDRGYYNSESSLNDPIYLNQNRVIPSDQLDEAIKWLNKMIQTESSRRPEQVYRYEETLKLLTDRLQDNKGIESIPLTKEEAEAIAQISKEGKFSASDFGLTLDELIDFKNIVRQSFKAGISAATISLILKVSPEIFKSISYLMKNGEIDESQFKKIGFSALSTSATAFINGVIASSLTFCLKSGLLGEPFRNIDSSAIGMFTVISMNVIIDSYEVAKGNMTRNNLVNNLIKNLYISTSSLICGNLTEKVISHMFGAIYQQIIPIPLLGYLMGSFIGSVLASFTFNIGQKAALSFCVDSGFTMFGLVDQDYKLPNNIIKEIGIDTFDYETFEIETFKPEPLTYETFEFDSFSPDSLDITYLRRGVIGVSKVSYIY